MGNCTAEMKFHYVKTEPAYSAAGTVKSRNEPEYARDSKAGKVHKQGIYHKNACYTYIYFQYFRKSSEIFLIHYLLLLKKRAFENSKALFII